MDENLVGYLLNSLDPDTHRQVESHLRADPEAQRRLDLLRRALEPLAADAEEEEAPPGLWVRTLGHLAHDQCRRRAAAAAPAGRALPRAPRPVGEADSRSWWRRADVLVAAVVLFAIFTMAVSVLPSLWHRHQVLACQDNLRLLGQALSTYSVHHNHDFPKVEAEPPRNVAGIFVPILRESGVMPETVTLCCPGGGSDRPAPCPTLAELEELRRSRPEAFQTAVRRLAGCYAYTLGYGPAPGDHHGLRDDDSGDLPILADRPPDLLDGRLGAGNSPNHTGVGQNVLYIDGHVRFSTTRTAGVKGDDIFVNQRGDVAAGRDLLDSVLGASTATPYPPEN
jgi:hypothetical protein